MSATCPNGHQSETTDYCELCGARMDGAGGGAPPTLPGATPAPSAASAPAPAGLSPDLASSSTQSAATAAPAPAGANCPACSTPRVGQDRFCENCGYDFEALVPPAAASPSAAPATATTPAVAAWEAVAVADRDYFDRIAPEGVTFPPHCPPRVYQLVGDEIRIGRRSNSRGILPEVDLSGAPEDSAISHLHCLLISQPDGSYSVVDPGSTNGTTVNDDPTPLLANTPVHLADGDRIHLGAWTTLTVRTHQPQPVVPASS